MTDQLSLEDFTPKDFQVSNSERKLHHIFDLDDCSALWAAYAAGRPLLVRGKPGTGKSQMAKAIAEQLGWAFVSEVIRGTTELSDLHWHFDAIGRLGEAQALCLPKTGDQGNNTVITDKLKPENFLAPGVFWWAFDWQSAQSQYSKCSSHLRPPPEQPDQNTPKGKGWSPENGGVVLLLDEIDKAEPDLPNGLLETLGLLEFTVPYLKQTDEKAGFKNPVKANPSRLLIVITTNEERELPKAFVRRCFVHTLKMEESAALIHPEAEIKIQKRHDWLMVRGRLHFGAKINDAVYQKAAKLLWDDRSGIPNNQYPPGLAEYIDLLTALQHLPHSEQNKRLDAIANYALKKSLEP